MTVRNRQVHNLFAFILPALGILMLLAVSSMAQAAKPDGPPGKFTPVETFDYRDFGSGLTTQRVYAVSNGGAVTQVIEDIVRDPELGQVIVTRSSWSDSVLLRVNVFTFVPTETDLFMVRTETYDGFGTLLDVSEYEPALSIRQSDMPVGAMLASAAVRLRTPGGAIEPVEQGTTRWNVALGLDEVSVPYGELTGALRIMEQHNSSLRMLWYYPGIGPVKRVESENGAIWRLTGCTGCP